MNIYLPFIIPSGDVRNIYEALHYFQQPNQVSRELQVKSMCQLGREMGAGQAGTLGLQVRK